MGQCAYCDEGIDPISAYDCHRCTGSFCSDHRLPENHDCPGTGAHNVGYGDGKLDEDVDVQRGGGLGGMLVLAIACVVLLVAVGAGGAFLFDAAGSVDVSAIGDAVGEATGSSAEEELNTTKAERLIHEEVNEHRSDLGVGELQYREDIASDARAHSDYLAQTGVLSHRGENGSTIDSRYPPDCTAVGENVAQTHWDKQIERNFETYRIESESELAKRVVEQWIGSPEHKENLDDGRWTAQGIGIAVSGDKIYVTQGFCG